MGIKIIQVESGAVARSRGIQRLEAHQDSCRFIEVDGVAEACDQVREADVDAVAG